MSDERYYKTMFTVGAVWNWAAALLFVAMAVMDWPILNWFLETVPESFLWYHLFFGLVAVYGLGYFWSSRDVYMNRNIIKMGILGKLLVFSLVGAGWLNGVVTILAAGAGAVDLIFAGLFIHVLILTKDKHTLLLERS